MMFDICSKLRTLLHVKSNKANNISGVVAQGDGTAINANTVNIQFFRSDSEVKQIKLTAIEKEVLFAMAEGAEIRAVRDGAGMLFDAFIFGNEKAKNIDQQKLPDCINSMFRKGLIDKDPEENLHFFISKDGRRIVQGIDCTETKK